MCDFFGPAAVAATSVECPRAEATGRPARYPLETARQAAFRDEIEAARSYDVARVRALAAIVPRLPETQRQAALRHALEIGRALSDVAARTQALVALAPHLPETEREVVLRDAREARKADGLMGASAKVLFLDIDGVVNNERTKKSFRGFMGIDPALAALVQRIVRNTGCKIVLSSSWRLSRHSLDEVETQIGNFADITPILHKPRGYEIKAWLMLHPEIEHYAILDDADSVLPEQRANFFQTTWEKGLTEDVALAVEKHLSG